MTDYVSGERISRTHPRLFSVQTRKLQNSTLRIFHPTKRVVQVSQIHAHVYIRKNRNTRLKMRAGLATSSNWSEDAPCNQDNHLLGIARLTRDQQSED